ncbi:MAG: pyridoxal 5'-phosphate synthase glutaminase subunit PdxT [Ardenticatenia bacterium]|nr:pyridoxal 5'-phosphate synthase glutaminase subunit PdxT [Ardenticatenia bacterium]
MVAVTTVGVLALQGDFREHVEVLGRLGVEAREVRQSGDVEGLDGLIIPGGESTTIGRLAVTYGLVAPIRRLIAAGHPVWGTCAGLIFLARDIGGYDQPLLGALNVVVERNAFGRQVDSFEIDLPVPALADVSPPDEAQRPFRAVFIRAPVVKAVGPGVDVLARLPDGTVVAVRQDHILGTAFHPELTDDTRFHRYFLRMVQARKGERRAHGGP